MPNWRIVYSYLRSLDSTIIGTAVVCFLVSYLTQWLAFGDINVAAIFPISGVSIVLMVFMGKRIWPGITIGVLAAHSLYFYENDIITSSELIANVIIAFSITLEVVVGYRIYKRLFQQGYPFNLSDDALKFTGLAISVSLISATIGSAALYWLQLIETNILLTWLLWWLANAVGILLFTPTLLSFTQSFKWQLTKIKLLEIVLIGIVVLIISSVAFNAHLAMIVEKSFPYLIVPLFLWLSFRFNLQMSIFGILIISIISILFSIEGRGPFLMDDNYYSILLLQIFIGVFSISSFVLSATVKERTAALKSVEEFNEKLEAQVKERTKKLKQEISERKKTESSLKISNGELRKTNHELDKFVYSVSHDLRAPVSSVLGLINLAQMENKSREVEQYLELMTKSVKQQDNFIHDILSISKNARLGVPNEKIDLETMVKEVFEQIKFVNHKRVTKKIDIQGRCPLYSDRSRLRVIFNNLISNSVRYQNGSQPKVEVSAKIDKEAVEITVRDNGTGISKEHLKNVFNMFYRATDANAGSGLGLYIVKETVEKLKGTIKIDSVEGSSTVVVVQIPNLS